MTRAKDELVFTSAADYGTARTRKVSRFVVEALDLPSPGAGAAQEPGARRRSRATSRRRSRCRARSGRSGRRSR